MHIDSNIIEDYNQNGVVILKNIISSLWIDKLRTGIEKNLIIQVNINVYMNKMIKKNYFMMIIVIGKE